MFKAFTDEVRAAARVEHPNVAQILDMSDHNGTHFVVTEYVPAPTLDKVIAQRGPLDPNTACQVVAQVAIALLFAHQQNVLHRDIKPGNVAAPARRPGQTDRPGADPVVGEPLAENDPAPQPEGVRRRDRAHRPGAGVGLRTRRPQRYLQPGVYVLYPLLTGQVAFPGLAAAVDDRPANAQPATALKGSAGGSTGDRRVRHAHGGQGAPEPVRVDGRGRDGDAGLATAERLECFGSNGTGQAESGRPQGGPGRGETGVPQQLAGDVVRSLRPSLRCERARAESWGAVDGFASGLLTRQFLHEWRARPDTTGGRLPAPPPSERRCDDPVRPCTRSSAPNHVGSDRS